MNETGYYNKMYRKVKIPEILKFCFEKQISRRSTTVHGNIRKLSTHTQFIVKLTLSSVYIPAAKLRIP